MDRKALSELIGTEVRIDYAGDGKWIELRCNDVLVAQIQINDVFDEEGNRFHDDCG